MGELTTRQTLFELMKIIQDPEYAMKRPAEPAYEHDPWPVVRMAFASYVSIAKIVEPLRKELVSAKAKLAIAEAELKKLKELMR